jgi:hypothetical protein
MSRSNMYTLFITINNKERVLSYHNVQGDSGEKINILGGDIGDCEKKKFI